MREIKFRAWDKIDEKLWNVISIDFIKGEVTLLNEYTKESYIREIDEVELMQYIGLKDKNKRKIYEGDLIKLCDKLIGKIEYNKEISAFVIRYLNSKKYKCLGKWISCYKVIGNIYKIQSYYDNKK